MVIDRRAVVIIISSSLMLVGKIPKVAAQHQVVCSTETKILPGHSIPTEITTCAEWYGNHLAIIKTTAPLTYKACPSLVDEVRRRGQRVVSVEGDNYLSNADCAVYSVFESPPLDR